MKRTLLTFIIGSLLLSCNNNSRKADGETSTQDSIVTEELRQEPETSSSFDINNILVSDKEIGDFPFFSFPEGLVPLNKPLEKRYDKIFFPLIDGIMTPVEGKSWKSYVSADRKNGEEWSLPYFERSYEEAILAVGGAKVFEGKVSKEELDRIKEEATYFGEEGSLGYSNNSVKTYVIRRADGDDVYIQFSGNSASGAIQIVQKTPFKQTITLIKSDEIKKQLDEKGKAVLHINFDTDKATLKPDGLEAISEIVKVLTSDPNLKIAINGYTDNSGSKEHNLKLSENRASAVKSEITKAGIAAERLTSKGFGQENPIADNSTEEGKSQNRRVELVKL